MCWYSKPTSQKRKRLPSIPSLLIVSLGRHSNFRASRDPQLQCSFLLLEGSGKLGPQDSEQLSLGLDDNLPINRLSPGFRLNDEDWNRLQGSLLIFLNLNNAEKASVCAEELNLLAVRPTSRGVLLNAIAERTNYGYQCRSTL